VEYARGIEGLLQQSGADYIELRSGRVQFGVLSYGGNQIYKNDWRRGFTRLEIGLATTLTLAYPILTVIVSVLTYLVTNGYLPPLSVH
jgi:hypothetical protein